MRRLRSFSTRSYPQQLSVDNIWPIKSLWNGWPNNNGENTTIPRTARWASNRSGQQTKNICDQNHLTDESWGQVDNACNLNDQFRSIFSLISKLFTIGKLIFYSALFFFEYFLPRINNSWYKTKKWHVSGHSSCVLCQLDFNIQLSNDCGFTCFLSVDLNGLTHIEQFVLLRYCFYYYWNSHYTGILLFRCWLQMMLWLGSGQKTF